MNHAHCPVSATGWHEGLALAPYAQAMRPAGGSDGTGVSGSAASSTVVGTTATSTAAGSTAATFRSAVRDIEAGLERQRGLRPELTFEQEPAPRKLAPFAASVAVTVEGADGDVGWGRFVLLYDPAGQRGWGGPFRIIAHIRVDLEPEIAADPLVGEVGWSWLTEALDARAVGYQQTSGTVTRVVTEGFGAKHGEPTTTEFELRASWSPACQWPGGDQPGGDQPGDGPPGGDGPGGGQPGDGGPGDGGPGDGGPGAGEPGAGLPGAGLPGGLGLDGHLAAWCDALCAAAGLPPLAAGVSALRRPRSRRQR
jgi:Protein of unknown function (DUF3000)